LRVPVADPVVDLAVRIVRRTRPDADNTVGVINEFVSYGAGPRAAQHLVMAAKARALMSGRAVVDAEDIRDLAAPVLRHRIITNFHAEARKVTTDDLVSEVLKGAA